MLDFNRVNFMIWEVYVKKIYMIHLVQGMNSIFALPMSQNLKTKHRDFVGDYPKGMNLGSKFLASDFNQNKQKLGLCFQSSEVHQALP